MKINITIFIIAVSLLFGCQREELNQIGMLVTPTTAEDPALPSLMVNGVPLHLETFGEIDQPIMIFLHGGPGSDYRSMISQEGGVAAHRYPDKRSSTQQGLSALQDDYFMVCYDRRGSGLSPRFDPDQLSFDDQMNDLKVLIEHFLNQKKEMTQAVDSQVYLFGWSFGGYLATAFANEHPKLVKDLILYESRPFNQELFDLMTVTSPFGQLTEDYVDAILTGSTYAIHTDHETADHQWMIGATGDFFPEFHNPENLPLWRSGFWANQEIEKDIRNPERDVVSQLSAFEGRALYLYGSKSGRDAVKPTFLPKLLGYLPKAESKEISNSGHYGPWENPSEVIQAIKEFAQ